MTLEEIRVSGGGLDGAPTTDRYPREMYYRIFAAQVLPPELDRLLKKRRLYTAPTSPDRRIRLGGRWLLCAAPILVHGDIEGGVLLPGSARDPLPEAEVIRAAATAAEFLARWMEE